MRSTRGLVRSLVLVCQIISSLVVGGCSGTPGKAGADGGTQGVKGPVTLLGVVAPSDHFVEATFNGPVGSAFGDPTKFTITGPGGQVLAVQGATVAANQVILVTGQQQPDIQYTLNASADLGIGSMGFVGSSTLEPYVQSAVSQGATSVLVTFSAQMDRQQAETASYYHLADPDGNQAIDVQVTAAKLQDDLKTVVLTTTPQNNVLYTLKVTNAKSRYTCTDGEVDPLSFGPGSSTECAQSLRPLTNKGAAGRVQISARTNIDGTQPTNATATGDVGSVQVSATGVGVGTSTCTGNSCQGYNGTNDQELTFKFDVGTRADSVVLSIAQVSPTVPQMTVFISSIASPGFDYMITNAQLAATTLGLGTEIHLDQFTPAILPANLMIDTVTVRATTGANCITSVCLQDGIRVDPTRSVAQFFGIPTVDITAPTVVKAEATGATSVLVTFSEPVSEEAADAARYAIPGLAVTDATLTNLDTQVVLTTTTQVAEQQYTVTVSGVQDRAQNVISPTANTATFYGITRDVTLDSAIALDNTHILLTFSEPMDTTTTQNISFYRIADPDTDVDLDISITGAVAGSGGKTVTLTTTPQKNIRYELIATNLRAQRDNFYIDPTHDTGVFWGIGAPDTTGPRLVSAVSVGDTSIILTFSEPVRAESASASNFTISPSLAVTGAMLTSQDTQIVLTTAPQHVGTNYTVTIANVFDKAGNPIDTSVMQGSAGNSGTFSFAGGPAVATSDDLPRVVGGISTGNTTAVITFSKPMSDDALNPLNYVMGNTDVLSEVGYVLINSVRFLGTDRTSVELTTSSQSEVTYTVTVVNVRDLTGNQFAAKQVVAGLVVDPTSCTFPGTPPSCGSVAGCNLPDSDGDGLPDNLETRGWNVVVVLAGGQTETYQVTGDPTSADTDGDGLSDDVERQLLTNPRDPDTDHDGLSDYEEYTILFTSPTNQDTDGDGIMDGQEVEQFKTNALDADSDGDGYSDYDELFRLNRDPRVSDLPKQQISVGNVRLQLDQRFTSTDDQGQTISSDSSTSATLETDQSTDVSHLSQSVGHFNIGVESGFDACATEACSAEKFDFLDRLFLKISAEGGAEFTTANTVDSVRATTQAYQSSLEQGQQLSTDHAVTNEVLGAKLSADVTLQNASNVGFSLQNVELRVATTDPNDPSSLVPVATLVPESGNSTFNISPNGARGPVVFSNSTVFPALIQDLMKSPRGLVFNVANYDLVTQDQRNFAFGLQAVQERTVAIKIDFGDGTAKEFHATTAGVLNRPRSELRCQPFGDHPGQLCVSNADCGSSTPCEGGKIVGGLTGANRSNALPIDFVLQSILGMRKSAPAQILAGLNKKCDTTAKGDDVQVVAVGQTVASPSVVVVSPGRNGVLDTVPSADDINSEGPRIVAGPDSTAASVAQGDDVQVLPAGTSPVPPNAIVISPGPDGVLNTKPVGDDKIMGPDGIRPGPGGAVHTVAQGDDVQLVPVATTGVPTDTVVISAGANGILDTAPVGGDVADVVTGYEVSATCSAGTPFAILAGANGIADTLAEKGTCTIASAPHFFGESCQSDADCGTGFNAATSTVAVGATASTTAATTLTLVDATAFPASGTIQLGTGWQFRFTARSGNTLTLGVAASNMNPLTIAAGTTVTMVAGRCSADTQLKTQGTTGLSPNDVVIGPKTDGYVVSVPAGDDIYVAPGIPCTQDLDCRVTGQTAGTCTGPQNVVRVDRRRRGQFRQSWALVLPDNTQLQTDFGQLQVHAGDTIALSFIQDIDRDGLSAPEEFLHGSSDFKKDTDGDGLGDFSEERIGWDVGVVGQSIRHVFSDPRFADTDGDGLSDKEEQDLRILQCACGAVGPKSYRGNGNLLRGQSGTETGGQPCTDDSQCGGVSHSCRDAVHCAETGGTAICGDCGKDVTLARTDPSLRDTDSDGVSDADEVFGYLTGAGVVDAKSPNGDFPVIAGNDGTANTRACPQNHCVENANPCQTDGDCLSHQCIHPTGCDEVQVVAVGTGGLAPRTVVVAPGPVSGSHPLALVDGGDTLLTSSDQKGDSRLLGDDQLFAGLNQSVVNPGGGSCVDGSSFAAVAPSPRLRPKRFPFCSVIRPGVDGRLASIAGGDDVVIPGGAGQRLETSDPLNPDTDQDLLTDGRERLLGSSPNDPADGSIAGDSDKDGLTDAAENQGWLVKVNGGPAVLVHSDPHLADTDGDGLPDYAEAHAPCVDLGTQITCNAGVCSNGSPATCSNNTTAPTDCAECPTDPTKADTDGDGISDFDELSATALGALARSRDFFPGFSMDPSTSKAYGTSPTNADTDGDNLTDSFELFSGWIVTRIDGTTVRVFSDPTRADTDGDGLRDDAERTQGTDPTNSDTDGDGRTDGVEVAAGTKPLRPDLSVTVTYSGMYLLGDRGDYGGDDWMWQLSVQPPGSSFPGRTLSTQKDCTGVPSPNGACMCNTHDLLQPLNKSVALSLAPGEGFVLSGRVLEGEQCLNGINSTIDQVSFDNCNVFFVDQPITFESLKGQSFQTRTFDIGGPRDCTTVKIVAEIAVNCEGTGRGLCRAGTPCVNNNDCDSNVCTGAICQAVCGNGVVEGSETCDDGNNSNCGSCNATCSGPGTGATCLFGNGCSTDNDCASGQCGTDDLVSSQNTCQPRCGDGLKEGTEACDDGNTLTCGTCNASCSGAGSGTCAAGTGCTVGADCASGTCASGVCQGCGDGVVQSGESCDDHNTSACGTCNATCDGEPATIVLCPAGTGCNTSADCASSNCVDNVCK
jgi:hypothetical protein